MASERDATTVRVPKKLLNEAVVAEYNRTGDLPEKQSVIERALQLYIVELQKPSKPLAVGQ